MSGYIGDISPIYRVSGGVDTIFRGEKSEGRYFRKYCHNIGDISARGDISEIFWKNRLWWPNIGNISEINRRFFGDISPPSCNVIWRPRSRPFFIRRPRCDSNGNMAIQRPDWSQFFIQRPKLIFNCKLMFQRLFWPKFIL